MPDAVEEFFQKLAARGHEPLLHRVSGTFRFEIGLRSWLVRVDKGDVAVSREQAAADCIIACEEPLFRTIVSGNKNAFAAGMRGDLRFEGDVGLGMLFQRIFPGPDDRVGTDRGITDEVPA